MVNLNDLTNLKKNQIKAWFTDIYWQIDQDLKMVWPAYFSPSLTVKVSTIEFNMSS